MMIYFLLLFVTVTIAIYIYDYANKNTRRWRLLSQFPGDATLPLIGNALQVGFNVDEVPKKLFEMWKRNGQENFRLTMGSENWVLICEPDDVGTILNHSTELFKPVERNEALMPFFGNSISSSQGEKWRSTRKLMTPCFHFKVLEQRVLRMNELSDDLIETLKPHEGKGAIDLYHYIRPHMLDIICETLMGVKGKYLSQPNHPYLNASYKIVRIATLNYFSYWRKNSLLFRLSSDYKEMHDTIKAIQENSYSIISEREKNIEEIKKEIELNNANAGNKLKTLSMERLSSELYLLDMLLMSSLPNGDPIPKPMLREEIDLVTFTGHYTTTMTMTNTLYYIAQYPKVQTRLIEEQRSIFPGDTSEHVTSHQLSQMKYLEAVIKETMRYNPTVTKIGRQLQQDLQLKDGRIVPAGTSLIVYYEGLFHNKKIFKDPYLYNPDRFFDPMHPYAFVPFSAGPRNCIGFRYAWMAMKITLSKIIRNFEIIEGGPENEPIFAARIITESTNGIKLKLKER